MRLMIAGAVLDLNKHAITPTYANLPELTPFARLDQPLITLSSFFQYLGWSIHIDHNRHLPHGINTTTLRLFIPPRRQILHFLLYQPTSPCIDFVIIIDNSRSVGITNMSHLVPYYCHRTFSKNNYITITFKPPDPRLQANLPPRPNELITNTTNIIEEIEKNRIITISRHHSRMV